MQQLYSFMFSAVTYASHLVQSARVCSLLARWSPRISINGCYEVEESMHCDEGYGDQENQQSYKDYDDRKSQQGYESR
jgi:hypothetical protein